MHALIRSGPAMRALVGSLSFVTATAIATRDRVSHAQEAADDAEAEMAKGEQFLLSQQYKLAILHFTAARIFAPERPGPYMRLGMTYAADGNCAEAIPFLEEYVKRKKSDPKPEAIATLARCKTAVAKPPGRLTVTSQPAGADIRVDVESGPLAGATPFESSALTPGHHRVFISKSGYQPVTVETEIALGALSMVRVVLSQTATSQVSEPAKAARPPEPVPSSEPTAAPSVSTTSTPPRHRPRYWIIGVVAAVVAAAAVVGIAVGVTSSNSSLPDSKLGSMQVHF